MADTTATQTNRIWFDASMTGTFNPEHYDLIWNDDYTQFRAVRLKWWDNESYAAWQSDSGEEDGL